MKNIMKTPQLHSEMSKGYSLRPAEIEDCRPVWEMANSPEIRAVSFSSGHIPYEAHEKWFREKLSDKNTVFLVLRTDGTEVIAGQIRFELKNQEWRISVSLKKDFRGKGLGSEMIKRGSAQLFALRKDAYKISAYIKKDNSASIRSFEKAGYENAGFTTINEENDAVLMVLKKDLTRIFHVAAVV